MNQCILTGRLTKDVEIRYFNDKANALFTLAVDSGYKDASGNPQVDFISCQAWNGQAEFLSKYCKKGDKVLISGRISVRNYQAQDGTTRFITEVVVDRVESLQPKEAPQQAQQPQPKPKNTGYKVNGQPQQVEATVDDTDLPF